jgi:cobalt-precorrin-5B (C1)-methyltransferase
VASRNRILRSGYTTGACAAAAAKAAALLLVGAPQGGPGNAEIPFPDGMRRAIAVRRVWAEENHKTACASVVKEASDDPDVTNGIEIIARITLIPFGPGAVGRTPAMPSVAIKGGPGVGLVTKPGLAVSVGEPAINPVPRNMIREAVLEAWEKRVLPSQETEAIEVVISVPEGEKIAEKTLNSRLGIQGGISILGTTGIVKPLSSEAWTATITASMSVARAMGAKEVVLSTGRTSEKAHMERYALPEEAYVMMGDYVQHALRESGALGFEGVHLCAQWAKLLKIAMAIPQTHVRHGAINLEKAASFVAGLGCPDLAGRPFNTAREMLSSIASSCDGAYKNILPAVCGAAKAYAESLARGPNVHVLLVSYEGEIIAEHG